MKKNSLIVLILWTVILANSKLSDVKWVLFQGSMEGSYLKVESENVQEVLPIINSNCELSRNEGRIIVVTSDEGYRRYKAVKTHPAMDALLNKAKEHPNFFHLTLESYEVKKYNDALTILRDSLVLDWRHSKEVLYPKLFAMSLNEMSELEAESFKEIVKKITDLKVISVKNTNYSKSYSTDSSVRSVKELSVICSDINNLCKVVEFIETFEWLIIRKVDVPCVMTIPFWYEGAEGNIFNDVKRLLANTGIIDLRIHPTRLNGDINNG